MTIENPTILSCNTICMAGQEDACNLAAVAGTEKKLTSAVPTGFTFIPVAVILDEFSADEHATPPVITLGIYDGDCDEFLGDQTLSAITAAYASESIILQPVPASTPVINCILVAGEFFAMEITQANGAALTARISVMGIYKPT